MKHLDQEECFKILEQTLMAFAKAVALRDGYTGEHQKRVADLSAAIAKEIGMSEFNIQGLRLAAGIHDLGNLGIPADLLNKPKLSEAESNLIKTHPRVGYNILKDIEFPWPIAAMVLQHHECMDGSGYPQGLKGDELILESRVLVVANTIDRLVSYRPSRHPIQLDEAIAEIKKYRGIKYDASVVDACVKVLNKGPLELELRMTESGRFTPFNDHQGNE